MQETIIDIFKPPTGNVQEASFYVCFSRLTSLKNLLILRPWYDEAYLRQHVLKHLTSARGNDFLAEIKRLQTLDEHTIKVYCKRIYTNSCICYSLRQKHIYTSYIRLLHCRCFRER